MHPFVFHVDRILPLKDVRLSPGQAGLLHGWGVFTTMRVLEGIPFAYERHWNRLARDAEKIQLPLSTNEKTLKDAVHQLIEANHVQSGVIRIYFVYNKVTLWHSDESFPAVDLIIYSIDFPTRVGSTQLTVMPQGRHTGNPLTGTKVTSWLNNVWHFDQARRRGFEDAIVLNERGEVAECTASNVFCVHKGVVSTPPISSGCLRGVTREILLETCPRAGIPIAEKPISVPELLAADEVFISSTTRNVQPVDRIDDRRFASTPGDTTARLAQVMAKYVREYLTTHSKVHKG
jgi:branched-chain amino acid aminotransferase